VSFEIKMDLMAIGIISSLIFALLADLDLTIYRVKKDYFGNNKKECRELITSIKK